MKYNDFDIINFLTIFYIYMIWPIMILSNVDIVKSFDLKMSNIKTYFLVFKNSTTKNKKSVGLKILSIILGCPESCFKTHFWNIWFLSFYRGRIFIKIQQFWFDWFISFVRIQKRFEKHVSSFFKNVEHWALSSHQVFH